MATRRNIDDNEIQSQLETVSMEDAFDLMKSLSGKPVRVLQEKLQEKLPKSFRGLGPISKKVTKFKGRKDQKTSFLFKHCRNCI